LPTEIQVAFTLKCCPKTVKIKAQLPLVTKRPFQAANKGFWRLQEVQNKVLALSLTKCCPKKKPILDKSDFIYLIYGLEIAL